MIVTAERNYLLPLSYNPSDTCSDDHDGSIQDFLSRPFPISTGTFGVGDTSVTFPVLDIMFQMATNTALTEKIRGKFLVRYDIKLQIVINANRFQQGRYILAAIPLGGIYEQVDPYIDMHRHSLIQITQLPHIQLDLCNDTQGELTLPWPGPGLGSVVGNVLNALTFSNPWKCFLYPYSPVVAPAGSTTVPFTLFASMTNVVLGFPTVPQMGTRRVRKKVSHPIDAEQKATGTGLFEKGFGVIDTVATTVGNALPLLSVVTAPISWVTRLAGKVCSIFGWSKPSNLRHTELVKHIPFAHMANCDGVDSSQPLSLSLDNAVGICPGFARTDIDEMSIDYLKTIPAYTGKFTWDTDEVVGTVTALYYIDPTVYSVVTTETISLTNYPPLTWLMEFFQYWRGSIVFNVKIVKTSFHSGRLLVVYTPNSEHGANTNANTTIAKSAYCYREIIDLKDKFEFSITVPFVHDRPWKNKNSGKTGRLEFIVLDPLVAPDTVSDTVTMLVEVCGGSDFEFAVPISKLTKIPCIPYTYQMGEQTSSSTEANATNTVIGGSTISSFSLWNVENCIGESIRSLRQLVKKYSYVDKNINATGILTIRPFAYEIAHNIDAENATVPLGRVDLLTHISVPYMLSRGSVRIKMIGQNTAVKARSFLDFVITGVPQSAVVVASTAAAVDRQLTNNLTQLLEHNEALSGECSVQVPQYHGTYARHVGAEICGIDFTASDSLHEIVSPIVLVHENDGNHTNGIHTYRAAGDDYNLGYFLSIPPYMVQEGREEE